LSISFLVECKSSWIFWFRFSFWQIVQIWAVSTSNWRVWMPFLPQPQNCIWDQYLGHTYTSNMTSCQIQYLVSSLNVLSRVKINCI